MTITRRLLLLSVLFTPLLAGCGLAQSSSDQHAARRPRASASTAEQQVTVSSGGNEPRPAKPSASPRQALERFAINYINWTYASLPAVQVRLAAMSVGAARAEELAARAQTQTDRVLAASRISNSGSVVAVAPVQGGHPGEWVVDTRERSGGDGEYAATREGFHVTLATVTRVPGGFVVSAWRPEL